ncbi:MAG: nucleoside-diphosphate sugar epimerase/dehydratase, partial [Phascolarctobacterium sp.]
MGRYYKTITILLFVALDYLALVAAEQCAYLIRNNFFHTSHLHISWINFWVVFPLLYIFFLNMGQLYSRRRPFYKEVEQLFQASLYGTLAVIFVLYVARIAEHTSRFFTGAFGIMAFVFMTLLRCALKNFLQRKQLLQTPVIIIGAGKTAELLVRSLRNDPGMGYKIIGLLEDNKVQKGILEKYPVLGGFADAEKVIAET